MNQKRVRVILLVSVAAILGFYLIVTPLIERWLTQQDSRQIIPMSDSLTTSQEIRIFTSKLAVFLGFAFIGGSVGSFLNVVAWSVPRGEPIVFRSSACPKCGAKIRAYDNLPVISYFLLAGRCRDCDVRIPIRYVLVEWAAGGIFASLFLFELVTGAQNVPGFNHPAFSGILWIVMYAKWDIIGIYIFHASLFSLLLTIALMELDRLRPPRGFFVGTIAVMLAAVTLFDFLQPVALVDQLPYFARFAETLRAQGMLMRLATAIFGGVFGFAVGSLLSYRSIDLALYWSAIPLAFTLLGIGLGWQATLVIAIIYGAIRLLIKCSSAITGSAGTLPASMLLLLVAFAHHPFWRWIAERLTES